MNMDKNQYRLFMDEFKKLALTMGCTLIEKGGTMNSAAEMQIKFLLRVNDVAAVKASEKDVFDSLAHLYDLEVDDYRREFYAHGQHYALIGFQPNRPKFCVLGESADGKRLLFTRQILKKLGVKPMKLKTSRIEEPTPTPIPQPRTASTHPSEGEFS